MLDLKLSNLASIYQILPKEHQQKPKIKIGLKVYVNTQSAIIIGRGYRYKIIQ